jgi:DNA-binding CsgD family transcriptional regulator
MRDPMVPGAIHVEDRFAMETIANPIASGVFEVVRRRRKGATRREIEVDARLEPEVVVQITDALTEARLLIRQPAKSGRPTSFTVAAREILIVADPCRDDHVRLVREHFSASTRHIVDELNASTRFDVALAPRQHRIDCRMALDLDETEMIELKRQFRVLIAYIEGVRSSRGKQATRRHRHCDHVLQIQVSPTTRPLLPTPAIRVTSPESLQAARDGQQSRLAELAPREREVAALVGAGVTRKQIATRLGISVNTVATLVRRAYRKLGVRDRKELLIRLARMELADEPESRGDRPEAP